MKIVHVVSLLVLCPLSIFSQESVVLTRQAVYLNILGGKTAMILSYEGEIARDLALQTGIGLNNFDRTASTTFRFGVSYFRGEIHRLELSALADVWTKVLNPIADKDIVPLFLIGYRYQPESGFTFRVAANLLQLGNRHYSPGVWSAYVFQGSIGYSF
jgi:hypothetical protein